MSATSRRDRIVDLTVGTGGIARPYWVVVLGL